MANYRTTLTADTAGALIVEVQKPRSLTEWTATFNAYGSFGGGTLSYKISTDGGTTKTTMKDYSGTAYSTTSADAIAVGPIGVSNHNGKSALIYVVLTGSTNPSITIDVLDCM